MKAQRCQRCKQLLAYGCACNSAADASKDSTLKRYRINCVGSTYEAISPMVDKARDISRRTFLVHVNRDDLAKLADEMGYARHPKQGLTLAADWAVSYHKSRYRGLPCVYLRWSAIEYIFY